MWGECGAVKQWEITSLLCAYCLPANRAFQTFRRAGARVRSFDLAKEARQIGELANSHGAQFAKKTCKLLLLILSITFI